MLHLNALRCKLTCKRDKADNLDAIAKESNGELSETLPLFIERGWICGSESHAD